ncbi:hypothetical protein F5Y04DRAFT_285739 [Hypomontagnella monticulosa]|nr:hypothetical protein F5Y04DRAFT_285739 [Hypomontagnella monticulosa]
MDITRLADIGRENVLLDRALHGEDVKSIDEMSPAKEILGWLDPTNYKHQHRTLVIKTQPGTGRWFLESPKFQEWFQNSNRTLFCSGSPGVGKTVMSSIVAEHIRINFLGHVGFAHLYCHVNSEHNQRSEYFLSSLLKQLIQNLHHIPQVLLELYNRHKDDSTQPTSYELTQTLHSISALFDRVFIIVDGLYECGASSECVTKFLSELSSFQTSTGANILITSRVEIPSNKRLHGIQYMEIRAAEEDLRTYIRGRMQESEYPYILGGDAWNTAEPEIIQAANGSFRLIERYMDKLVRFFTSTHVEMALRDFHKLDKAYRLVPEKIESQDSDDRKIAMDAISWVTETRRPLSKHELIDALAITLRMTNSGGNQVPDLKGLESLCSGLITVNNESGIVHLAHDTIREYLDQAWSEFLDTTKAMIAEVCVEYLSSSSSPFETGFRGTASDFEKWLKSNPFYYYAVNNWEYHIRPYLTKSTRQLSFLIRHLERQEKVEATYSDQSRDSVTSLHLVAYYGIEEAVKALISREGEANVKNMMGQTPLIYASKRGHTKVAALLLDHGASIDLRDNDGLTPLSWAAKNGNEGVVKLLLKKGANAKIKDNNGLTPFSWAVKNSHISTARMLRPCDIPAGRENLLIEKSNIQYFHHAHIVFLATVTLSAITLTTGIIRFLCFVYAGVAYIFSFKLNFSGAILLFISVIICLPGLKSPVYGNLDWIWPICRVWNWIRSGQRGFDTPISAVLPGRSRVLWKCTCGNELCKDFSADEVADALMLYEGFAQSGYPTTLKASPQPGPGRNRTLKDTYRMYQDHILISSVLASGSDNMGSQVQVSLRPGHRIPQAPATDSDEQGYESDQSVYLDDSDAGNTDHRSASSMETKMWLLFCFPYHDIDSKAIHIRLQKLINDEELFRCLRQNYLNYKIRPWMTYLGLTRFVAYLTDYKVKKISFVQFRLWPGKYGIAGMPVREKTLKPPNAWKSGGDWDPSPEVDVPQFPEEFFLCHWEHPKEKYSNFLEAVELTLEDMSSFFAKLRVAQFVHEKWKTVTAGLRQIMWNRRRPASDPHVEAPNPNATDGLETIVGRYGSKNRRSFLPSHPKKVKTKLKPDAPHAPYGWGLYIEEEKKKFRVPFLFSLSIFFVNVGVFSYAMHSSQWDLGSLFFSGSSLVWSIVVFFLK